MDGQVRCVGKHNEDEHSDIIKLWVIISAINSR